MTQIHNLVSVKCISEKCHRKYGGSNPQHRVLYTIYPISSAYSAVKKIVAFLL